MKFYVKDIPDQWPVFQYIAAKTNLKVHLLKSRFNVTDLISLEHKFDINSIKESVLEILKITEPKGWLTAEGRSKPYTGISLVYNPNLQEDIDPNYQTLGTAYNTKDEFFWKSTNKVPHLKNSYFDTYSFRKISPAITGKLLDMISAFDAPLIRSRIGIVDANETVLSEVDKQGWHKDEPVFENLRINIPITTDEDCLFQIEGNEPEHLPYGNMYTWDTFIPHRVFASKIKPAARIHIVLGFSPWFNYNQEDDSWETNEFFGKKHPIDMLVDGELCSLIKGIKQS
jgi:hypothetical protein